MSKTILMEKRSLPPRLLIARSGVISSVDISGKMLIGRSCGQSTADIDIDARFVSRSHGEITENEYGYGYTDLGSTNGTYCNGRRLEPGERVRLGDGDVLHIFSGAGDGEFVTIVFVTDYPSEWRSDTILLSDNIAEINIGRSGRGGILMSDAAVSVNHASFFIASSGWAIVDHKSTNGVYLNGSRIDGAKYLRVGDCVRIVNTVFIFDGDRLLYQRSLAAPSPSQVACGDNLGNIVGSGGAAAEKDLGSAGAATPARSAVADSADRMHASAGGSEIRPDIGAGRSAKRGADRPAGRAYVSDGAYSPDSAYDRGGARHARARESIPGARDNIVRPAGDALDIHITERSVWQRAKKLMLLQNINMRINAGEMVLILGGSGAGKTTFMNAVMGYEKAEGRIMHGSTDIYEDFESMKYKIGFVPQQDLLRGSDTVYDTLENAAEMKLPSSLGKARRGERIESVLGALGLSRERDSLVSKLSGGQRKRLSIAVEYIADPSLFFLDEPDSGLDGVMARTLMENLRHIADEGKIVMVISHGPDRAADLFDKVIVLAKSAADNCGHLAFFGSVREAHEFFDTDTLEGAVRRINREDEGGDGMSDYYIQRFAERM